MGGERRTFRLLTAGRVELRAPHAGRQPGARGVVVA